VKKSSRYTSTNFTAGLFYYISYNMAPQSVICYCNTNGDPNRCEKTTGHLGNSQNEDS